MKQTTAAKAKNKKGLLTIGWIALGLLVALIMSVSIVGVAEAAPVDDARIHAICAVLAEQKGDMQANMKHVKLMQPYVKDYPIHMLYAGARASGYVLGYADASGVPAHVVADMQYSRVCNQLALHEEATLPTT